MLKTKSKWIIQIIRSIIAQVTKMAKNLGAIVGTLMGGALGFLTAKKYYTTLSAALGVATYPLTIGAGALALGYIGKRLYNKNK